MPNGGEALRHVRASDREVADPTEGMRREQAIATDHLWAGHVTTDPGAVSGWHHHGAYESSIYVVSGSLVMESGPGGADRIAASAGDFIYVPPGAIHRESNPGADASTLVVVRAGQGPPTINVDGPAPAEH